LLSRVCAVEILACPGGGSRRQVIAVVMDLSVVRVILEARGLPAEPPARSPARPPPQPVFDFLDGASLPGSSLTVLGAAGQSVSDGLKSGHSWHREGFPRAGCGAMYRWPGVGQPPIGPETGRKEGAGPGDAGSPGGRDSPRTSLALHRKRQPVEQGAHTA